MNPLAYNIITMSKSDYLKYHWERTKDARRKVGTNEIEWHLIWEKNYWIEYAAALEVELKETRKRLKEALQDKYDAL